MRIAYLVNQYPKVSHSFIRREILALEKRGVEVMRYSIRRVGEPLADPMDQAEEERTRFVLDGGKAGLAAAMARVAAKRPAAFARATELATRIGVGSERGVAYHGAYLGEACVLLEWAEADGVEHVHAHFGTNSATVAMLLAELGGPGFSMHVHGPEEFDKPFLISLGEKIERARFTCAISSFGRSQLYRRVSHSHWDKVHIVRCGVEREFFEAGDHPPIPEAPRLVSVGRLSEQKGQMLLVEALGRVADAGHEFELVLVGDGELREEVETALRRNGIAERVTITGWAASARVREEILAARAMVLPSFAEGLPVVIMEALGLRRPVLTTYVAGIPELVRDHGPKQNGWLIPAGSVDALASAVVDVLETPVDDLRRMGDEGQKAVFEFHDSDVTAAALHDLLRKYVR